MPKWFNWKKNQHVDGSILKDELRVDDIGLLHCGGAFEIQLNEEIGRKLKEKGCECR
jgi:hypothetical protein